MRATSYAMMAAALFAIISVLQLVRALAGWPITVGGTMDPRLGELDSLCCCCRARVDWIYRRADLNATQPNPAILRPPIDCRLCPLTAKALGLEVPGKAGSPSPTR